jgi:cellobiose phosphorylase
MQWPYIIKKTGDRRILSEEAPFLSSPPLEKGEHDRYENPELSEEEALEVHCRRGNRAGS